MKHRRAPARRQPLPTPISPSRTARSTSAWPPSRAAARQRPRPSPPNATARGPFRSLFDFCERLDLGHGQPHGRRIADQGRGASTRSGARRSQWFAVIDRAFQSGAAAAADRRRGQRGLFGDDEEEDRRPRPPPACPTSPSGTSATGWPRRKKSSDSIFPAIPWPNTSRRSTPIARTPRSKPRRCRTAPT